MVHGNEDMSLYDQIRDLVMGLVHLGMEDEADYALDMKDIALIDLALCKIDNKLIDLENDKNYYHKLYIKSQVKLKKLENLIKEES